MFGNRHVRIYLHITIYLLTPLQIANIYTVLLINKYALNNSFNKKFFFSIYQDFIISGETEYNQNKYHLVSFILILKLGDELSYVGSNISSTESDVNIGLTKVWTAIGKLSIMWKSDLSSKIKRDFFKLWLCNATI